MRRPLPQPLVLLAPALLIGALLGACREEPAPAPMADARADELVRERAAAHFSEGREGEARAELAPLVARADATAADLVGMAALEFLLGETERTRALLARVERLEPRHPGLRYLLGQIAKEEGEFELAERHLRVAHEVAPDDLPARLELAGVLRELDRLDEAEALFRSVMEVGLENGQGWYVSAVYQLQRLLLVTGRGVEAEPLIARSEALRRQGFEAPFQNDVRLGNLARPRPPTPRGNLGARPLERLSFSAEPLELTEFRDVLELLATDLDGDGRLELLARTPRGLFAARREGDAWRAVPVLDEPVDLVRTIDLDNGDDRRDLVVAQGARLRFLRAGDWTWSPEPALDLELPAAPADLVAVDFDHEGDLDLFVVGSFGARLFRNDGADEPRAGGRFRDVSEAAGLPREGAFTWCLTEDFDDDSDVDLLCGGPAGVYLGDSLRAGRFADRSRALAGLSSERRPLVADVDGDGRADLVVPGSPTTLWLGRGDFTFERRASSVAAPADAGLVDLDLDGSFDLAWTGGAALAFGLPQERRVDFAQPVPGAAPRFGDFAGLGRVGIAALAGGRVHLHHAAPGPHRSHLVALRGKRDNRAAVGARVVVRRGAAYQRIYYRGEPVLIGAGLADSLDVLRVSWPSGGVDTRLSVPVVGRAAADDPVGGLVPYEQQVKQFGSCPFLYTWNGETFEFITDVLGITPLGLPIAPGLLVPPDHDEYVLVRGDQLVPREGELVLQVTEELREVTYLDRIRLHALDRPAGVEVFPNERFCFPPFPVHHVHTVREALAPISASGSDGRDWAGELAAEDGVHAVPFVKESLQYAGLARPWSLELAFDRERIASARGLRLVMSGWFYWSDASANMAAAHHPRIAFVPPMLEVPDGEGGWRGTGPPIGFPAGKTKTMVVDVSHLQEDLAREGRLRLSCTLQLYWDRIVLAIDGDDAPYVETVLEPSRARLYQRGFSEMVETGRDDLPELFDWDRVEVFARWDQHPGRYTRLGDCLELLTAIDDRFVIFGAGDALEVAFDAAALPPLAPGHVRDWLVFFDGWAKDRDPNTLEALEVEPLPFHGMSGYPYGPDEAFPDTEEHRRWRAEWNTRPARRWITPLEPAAPDAPHH